MNGDSELLDLFAAKTPLIDVRAPIEFVKGAIPGAVNLPLLNDEERDVIGKTYKSEGQEAAIAVGRRLVSGGAREARVQAWSQYRSANQNARIYCWRGGLRSQLVKKALRDERGIEVDLIEGGYKRARNLFIETTERIANDESFAVITGFTGAGKTEFLRGLGCEYRFCDLEGISNHQGSAFGRLSSPQPTQVNFENKLAVDLWRNSRLTQKLGPILIEDESRTIGKNFLPPAVIDRILKAPLYMLERPRPDRARLLIRIYLQENYGLVDGRADAEKIALLKADAHQNLRSIEKRLGGLMRSEIAALLDIAVAEHLASGSFEAHLPWVERLLASYYDKLYAHHLEREASRIVFRGDQVALEQKLRENRQD